MEQATVWFPTVVLVLVGAGFATSTLCELPHGATAPGLGSLLR
jgi:hypothetical protein